MARKPRIHYPGALYHVILRGNAREDIFFTPADRTRFFLLLQEGVERFECRVHAYCLMTNHVHLVVQVGEIPLSRLIQNLAFRYTRYINRKKQRVGHLFQGRFKALLVDMDEYLLQLTSYLHLNPLRVGMVSDPKEYPWSSHRAYLGLEEVPWLETETVLSLLSSDSSRARSLIEDFVLKREGEGHRTEFHRGGAEPQMIGGDGFVENVLRRANRLPFKKPTLRKVVEKVMHIYGLRDEDWAAPGQGRLISEARALAAWAVLELSDATLTELGKIVRRDATSLSSSARRLHFRAGENAAVSWRVQELRNLYG